MRKVLTNFWVMTILMAATIGIEKWLCTPSWIMGLTCACYLVAPMSTTTVRDLFKR